MLGIRVCCSPDAVLQVLVLPRGAEQGVPLEPGHRYHLVAQQPQVPVLHHRVPQQPAVGTHTPVFDHSCELWLTWSVNINCRERHSARTAQISRPPETVTLLGGLCCV
jgi:hypothetical protein